MKDFLLTHISAIVTNKILENVSILVSNQKIKQFFTSNTPLPKSVKKIDGKGCYALPGFIDTHIHGMAGFGPEIGTEESLLQLSLTLAKQGVTAFAPTLYCARPKEMAHLLTKLVKACGQEKGAKIVGFHLEGPFISPLKPGVMKPSDIALPNLNDFMTIWEASQGKILSMTLAPELPNLTPIISFCKKNHITLQIGHSNASYEQLLKAKEKGITHVTHLFNAMSPFHHRALGVAGTTLIDKELSCEIIADGFHFHPNLVAFLKRVKPINNIVLITDALLPTTKKNPPFLANNEEVVLEDHVWKRKTDKVIAGSALTMNQGLKNLVSWGYSLPQAVKCASTNPAKIHHLKNIGSLTIGKQADIVLLDNKLNVKQTFINGVQFL